MVNAYFFSKKKNQGGTQAIQTYILDIASIHRSQTNHNSAPRKRAKVKINTQKEDNKNSHEDLYKSYINIHSFAALQMCLEKTNFVLCCLCVGKSTAGKCIPKITSHCLPVQTHK